MNIEIGDNLAILIYFAMLFSLVAYALRRLSK